MYLIASEPGSERRGRTWLFATCATVAVHSGLALGLSQLEAQPSPSAPELIVMRVVHNPPPKPTAVTPPPVEVPEAPPVPQPLKKKSRVLKKQKSQPKAAPTASLPQPMPTEEPQPVASKPPPLVVGLTLSSTTSNGNGPRFAVGNTLMGTPSNIASQPVAGPMVRGATSPRPSPASDASPSDSNKIRIAAKLRRSNPPFYPPEAKREGLEGVVVLTITINARGAVEQARILRGLSQSLDASALSAAKQTLWSPATVDGRAVTITRRFNVRFTLQS